MQLGILGTGKIVQDFLTMVGDLPAIKLTAILSTPHSVERAHDLQTNYDIDQVYTDYAALLADPQVDTVYVALPNSLHYDFSKQALAAGKNVICEKPFTLNSTQFAELAALALKKDLVLIEAITNQYLPNYQRIRADLAKLGDLKIVDCNYSQYSSRYDRFKQGIILPAFNPKLGGGALMDLNIYNIHFVVGLLGAPTAVHYAANVDQNIDTSGVLTLDYPETKVVCIGAKDCDAPIKSTLQGNQGSIVVAGPTNTVENFTETMNGGTAEKVALNRHPHRMFAEFAKFEQVITTHDMTFVKQQLQHSKIVMAVVDAALADAGIELG